jgi:hypothetical protein
LNSNSNSSVDQKEKQSEQEEFEIVGRQLNEIYLDTIERAQKAQSKLHFKINEKEKNAAAIICCAIYH